MRNLLIISILIYTFSLTSCYQNNKEVETAPDHLLSKDQMIEIITQIQLAEGKVVLEREKNKDYRLTGKEYTQALYHQFDITPEQLIENLNYYQEKEDVLVDIYEEVIANLSTMEDEVKIKIKEKQSKIKSDSIHRADSVAQLMTDSVAQKQVSNFKAKTLIYLVKTAERDSTSIPSFI